MSSRCWSVAGASRFFLILAVCMAGIGCGDSYTREVTQITLSKGIVKVGMSARDVKPLLGTPLTASSHTLTCSSATGTNAESTRMISWLMETAVFRHDRKVRYDLLFKKAHPWGELPGDPVSGYGGDDAGWTLETIRLHVME